MPACPQCAHMNHPDVATCARCGTVLQPDSSRDFTGPGLAAGTILHGRYTIERPLGRGGMAEVYVAMDRRLARRVALKLLGTDLLRHRTARRRMETEAAALGRVRHPNVIEINNVFDHDGRLVLDLELVEGGTLAARIPQGGLPVADAVRLMSSILAGLGALHRAGLVHRDVKPANILLTGNGIPKIADLGVARDEMGYRPTRTGTVLGTPMYMSPEQIRPRPGSPVDRRADIYACGIVLYEMLTGDPPFKADSEFDIMAMQVSAPPDLERLRAVPGEIVFAVRVALEKEPERRWQCAEDFQAALGLDPERVRRRERASPAVAPGADRAAPRDPAPPPPPQTPPRAEMPRHPRPSAPVAPPPRAVEKREAGLTARPARPGMSFGMLLLCGIGIGVVAFSLFIAIPVALLVSKERGQTRENRAETPSQSSSTGTPSAAPPARTREPVSSPPRAGSYGLFLATKTSKARACEAYERARRRIAASPAAGRLTPRLYFFFHGGDPRWAVAVPDYASYRVAKKDMDESELGTTYCGEPDPPDGPDCAMVQEVGANWTQVSCL